MPTTSCKYCKKKFYAKPYFIKIGQGKYCSPDCQHAGRRNGRSVACGICGKQTYKKLLQLKRSKSGKFFCSKSCQTVWRNQEFSGVNHPNWKDGMSTYRLILSKQKIKKFCTFCKSKDKRILAVHHIDKNRRNNDVSNLAWLCHNCHFLVHHYKDETLKFMKNLSVYKIRRKSS